jgi:transposase
VYKPVRNQVEMMLRDLDSILPEDHLARAIWAVVETLDLSEFYAPIKAVDGEPGHPATDPQVLVALWLYATADGVGKAREVDRLCHEHDAYRWLRGGVPINYHLLSDFRVEHRQALDDLMSRILAAMMADGTVTLDTVSHDGMRVRASAGADSFRREGRLEEFLAAARVRVAALAAEGDETDKPTEPLGKRQEGAQRRAARERLERIQQALAEMPSAQAVKKTAEERQNARVSTTDPEARVMKMGDGGFRPAYNIHLATDTPSLVVTGVTVTNRGADSDEASPMLRQVAERSEKQPKNYLTDGGISTRNEVEKFAAAGVTLYSPTRTSRDNGSEQTEPLPTDSPAVAAWRVRMGTDEAKATYRQRAATSECVNAQLRTREGLYQFVVRGLAKVTSVVLWMVITHNILRWIALRT